MDVIIVCPRHIRVLYVIKWGFIKFEGILGQTRPEATLHFSYSIFDF